jgi:hypothetical protein
MSDEEESKYDSEQAESYAEVLRYLAFYVGTGGYNADDPIDANVFQDKILSGINRYIDQINDLVTELNKVTQELHDTQSSHTSHCE